MSNRKIGLVLAGAGAVGSNLLRVVERKFAHAHAKQLQLAVVAIGDSRGFVLCKGGLSWDHVRQVLAHKASGNSVASWSSDDTTGVERTATNLLQVVEELHTHGECDHNVLIDCTSSQAIAPALVHAKQLGFAVLLANKLPLSCDSELYDQLVFSADGAVRSPLVQYEATVGAGLPVISTLKRIVASCDTITSVQGSFSGTIGYVLAEMNRYMKLKCPPNVHTTWTPQRQYNLSLFVSHLHRRSSFSAALSAAHALGITEPDPRDDLSVGCACIIYYMTMMGAACLTCLLLHWLQGADVARKMVILAREMGLKVEMSSVKIEKLIPDELFALSVPEFLAMLSQLDAGTVMRDASLRRGLFDKL